jgi:hypothetical protein
MDDFERLEALHAGVHMFVDQVSAYRNALITADFHPVIAEQMTRELHWVLMKEYDRELVAMRQAGVNEALQAAVKELEALGIKAAS